MRRTLPVLLAAALLLLGLAPAVAAEGVEANIAVMNFDDVHVAHWWEGGWDVGNQFTVLVTDELVNSGKFNIMERTRLDEIVAEQHLQTSGAVDEATAVQIGKLLGVRIMVLGSVTTFQMTGVSGLSFGNFGLGLQNASVKLSARLVDVQTGQILGSAKGEGSAQGASFDVHLSGVSFATEKFRSTTLGKASVKAVDQLVKDLAGKITANAGKLTTADAQPKLTGKVVAVLPNQIVIDLGQNKNVRKGQVFSIFRLQQIEGLTDPVRIPVGTIKVTSVDKSASVCVVVSSETPVQAGDAIEAQ